MSDKENGRSFSVVIPKDYLPDYQNCAEPGFKVETTHTEGEVFSVIPKGKDATDIPYEVVLKPGRVRISVTPPECGKFLARIKNLRKQQTKDQSSCS